MTNLFERVNEGKTEELSKLDAIKIVDFLFSGLLDREKDILSRRYGLKGGRGETLEKIGGLHKLTRERVRQIETKKVEQPKPNPKPKPSSLISELQEAISHRKKE